MNRTASTALLTSVLIGIGTDGSEGSRAPLLMGQLRWCRSDRSNSWGLMAALLLVSGVVIGVELHRLKDRLSTLGPESLDGRFMSRMRGRNPKKTVRIQRAMRCVLGVLKFQFRTKIVLTMQQTSRMTAKSRYFANRGKLVDDGGSKLVTRTWRKTTKARRIDTDIVVFSPASDGR